MVKPINKKSQKVLIGKEEIMEYLNVSKILFSKFVKAGMPVLYMDGRFYAHSENLDEYFKGITRVTMKNIPNSELENGKLDGI